jgi:hypothetical protein
MLFDLRGAGRRTTIKIVYLSLAVLMGGGLVLFGIGGDVSGGLFDAFGERNSTTDTGKGRYEDSVEAAQRETRIDPDDPVTYADLARARYQLANAGDNFDQQTGQYSAEGKRQLTLATEAWERHLALEPKQADDGVASLMVIAYGPQGLNELEQAVAAQEVITEVRPKSATFATLAILAYQAGQTRKGDLATDQAIERADPDDRKTLRAELKSAKEQALQQQLQNAQPSATPAPGE